MKAGFKAMQAVGIKETTEAVAVLEEAISRAKDMQATMAGAKSVAELEMVMEKFARETPLPYLLIGIVGPMLDVQGGMKSIHAATIMHAAMDVEFLSRQMAWDAQFQGMSRKEIVLKLADIAKRKKAALQ